MSKVNLEALLDQDGLTAQQERTIRKMVKYQLKINGDRSKITVIYKLCNLSLEGSINLYFDDLEKNKINVYKYIMYELIICKFESKNIKNKELLKETDKVAGDSYGDYLNEVRINEQSQKLYGLLMRINKDIYCE